MAGNGLAGMLGWATGTLFGKYLDYDLSIKQGDPLAVWSKRFSDLDMHSMGFDMPSPYRGVVAGAMDAVVELGKEDPALVSQAAKEALDKLPISQDQKVEFIGGFRKGFDLDTLSRLYAEQKK